MLGVAATDLCTKFEISTLTHYKDMKDDKSPIIGAWFCSRYPFLYAQLWN